MKQIPEVRMDRGIPTLYVKGEPFLAFAGEVHNSSASSLAYMEERVWNSIEGMNLNTLIVPVYWELLENTEGSYDYALLDGIIGQAREHGKHLILLWFGLWKNSESMYVPGWMKQDSANYFRVQKVTGEKIDTVSPFCECAIEKDAMAFAALMAHIREFDGEENTVLAVQVENEVGLLGTERDYCPEAEKAFQEEIPGALAGEYHVMGNWKEAFGENAEEYFMAYYLSKALEKIACAGREEYPIPYYANVWLKQHPWYPGSYPSGGPVREVHRIWKKMAPSLFTIAPDIYVPYAVDVMDEYHYDGNPLLIPEARKDAVTASYAFYAFMKHNAVCYSPFGIEDLGLPPELVMKPTRETMEALNINPIMFNTEGGKEYLSKVYGLLENLKPLYLRYRGTEQMGSYIRGTETDLGTYLTFRDYDIVVDYFPAAEGIPISAGAVFELARNRFLLVGMMSRLTFRAKAGENRKVRALKLEDGTIVDGQWVPGRRQNGDEQMQFNFGPAPGCLSVELYKY